MKNVNNILEKTVIQNGLWRPIIASVICTALIPVVLQFLRLPQARAVKAIYLRDDNRVFRRFADDLKNADGVLILGTSETNNTLDGLNYWSLLNQRRSAKNYFSVFAGAGLSCSTYFPLMLSNPDSFNKLNILLYVNPTYWRQGLNNFRADYYERYVGSVLFEKVRDEARKRGLYDRFMKPALFDSIPAEKINVGISDNVAQRINNFKSYYYYDLMRVLNDNENIAEGDFVIDEKGEDSASLKFDLDMEHNVSRSYFGSATDIPFPAIDVDSTFQYEALNHFLLLSKDFGINVTVYLGPYNAIYCKYKNPDLVGQYEEVVKNIRLIVNNANVPLIDGSDLSNVEGTFLDVQHISKYGAFLTAKQISKHYETVKEKSN